MRKSISRSLWLAWIVSTMALAGYFYAQLDGDVRTAFVPGATSAGHYQIEVACEACHTEPYAGPEAMQAACESCHAEELEEARDSHPQSKFTDPRNADRIAKLDARYCVTCHVEHKPERTLAMGLTLAGDYCVLCHADVAEERPSHDGLAFATCASAGCHNFHDNRALYEDFLLRHAGEPEIVDEPQLVPRNFAAIAPYLDEYPKERYPIAELSIADADGPVASGSLGDSRTPQDAEATDVTTRALTEREWANSAHARAGANCSACHIDRADGTWRDAPGFGNCADCHARESAGFTQGRHGMRGAADKLGRKLPAMRVADARLPMQPAANDRVLDCSSCHDVHTADTRHAVVDACLQCHSDKHSVAYDSSPHAELWRRELAGELPAGSAVTCASCHMPRVQQSYGWGAFVHNLVQHNQNATLRPNEKMLRPVCLQCHGYEFSVNSLADRELIENNFSGAPGVVVQSTAMAIERRAQIDREREAARR